MTDPVLSQPCAAADPGALWAAAMRRGDVAAAHALSDAVLAARDPARRDDPALPYHLRWVWDGRPFDGRRVLVRCYHGLGDTLQFARFLAPLRARAAGVTLEAQPELLPLLASLDGPDEIVPFALDRPQPPAACDIEVMELPHALRLAPEAAPAPYLAVPGDRIAAARARLAAAERGHRRPAIGVCWRAGDWDAARSVPLAALLPHLTPAERTLVSLQRGAGAAEAAGTPLLDPGDRSADVLATAALVAALDAVVTVDTMVAHLAGALGRPTLLLLRHEGDWRWMEGRDDTPWYPSMRLFRQSREGDWQAPLAHLAAALRRDLPSPAARP